MFFDQKKKTFDNVSLVACILCIQIQGAVCVSLDICIQSN